MNYLTYGDPAGRAVMLVHGLCATAESCFGAVVAPLVGAGYRVILPEVDGHSDRVPGDFVSLAAACDDIEAYVERELSGSLWCLGGFSMGATFAVEVVGRGHLDIDRLFLDAAVLTPLGLASPLFTWLFCQGTAWLEEGRPVPEPLLAMVMGKGNRSVAEMLYPRTSQATIRNACRDLFDYHMPEGLLAYRRPVEFWRGSREPYPARSAELLRRYLPQMQERVFPDLGHGQLLHEHPREYAEGLLAFLGEGRWDR